MGENIGKLELEKQTFTRKAKQIKIPVFTHNLSERFLDLCSCSPTSVNSSVFPVRSHCVEAYMGQDLKAPVFSYLDRKEPRRLQGTSSMGWQGGLGSRDMGLY